MCPLAIHIIDTIPTRVRQIMVAVSGVKTCVILFGLNDAQVYIATKKIYQNRFEGLPK